jgi:hypothetical protein
VVAKAILKGARWRMYPYHGPHPVDVNRNELINLQFAASDFSTKSTRAVGSLRDPTNSPPTASLIQLASIMQSLHVNTGWLSDPTRIAWAFDLRSGFGIYRPHAVWRSESIPAFHEEYGDRRWFAGVFCFRWRRLFARCPKHQVNRGRTPQRGSSPCSLSCIECAAGGEFANRNFRHGEKQWKNSRIGCATKTAV